MGYHSWDRPLGSSGYGYYLTGLVIDDGLLHVWIGYISLSLLILRLPWGFVGTNEASFSSFIPSISAIKEHIANIISGKHCDYVSHSPFGTFMVYALWGTLLIVIVTRLTMTYSPLNSLDRKSYEELGILSGYNNSKYEEKYGDDEFKYKYQYEEELEKLREEIHEQAVNLLIILSALHVSRVVFEMSRASNHDLISRMTFRIRDKR